MILLIDNYDSFTYNLYQAVGVLTKDITVARNDEITIDEIEKMSPAAIIISLVLVIQRTQEFPKRS